MVWCTLYRMEIDVCHPFARLHAQMILGRRNGHLECSLTLPSCGSAEQHCRLNPCPPATTSNAFQSQSLPGHVICKDNASGVPAEAPPAPCPDDPFHQLSRIWLAPFSPSRISQGRPRNLKQLGRPPRLSISHGLPIPPNAHSPELRNTGKPLPLPAVSLAGALPIVSS